MIWFLRLFPAYRMLISEREAMKTAVVRMESYGGVLQGLLDAYKEQSESKNRRIEELTAQLVESTQKTADFMSRTHFGRTVFGAMPEIPAVDIEKRRPVEHPRPQAYDIVQKKTAEFFESVKRHAASQQQQTEQQPN